jgi:glycosyltransferase involved in cell wall biosynthesis
VVAQDTVGAPQRRLDVLHVITRFHGGSGGNVMHSVEDASHYGYRSRLLCGTDDIDPRFVARAQAAGCPVDFCPRLHRNVSPFDDLACLLWLRRYIRAGKFDVVHTHGSKAGLIGRLAARLARVPAVIHTFHGLSFDVCTGALARAATILVERMARRWADHYVSVGQTLARQAVDAGLAPVDRITTVHTAVDIDALRDADVDVEEKKWELGLPKPHIVGSVGRLTRQKGFTYFIQAAERIARERPDVGFLLVGSGEATGELSQQAREADLGGTLVMSGERADVPEVLQVLDVFVVSSLWEGFGRALTEALVVGCPVVATAVNSVPDFVRDGDTGRLVPPADPDALAEAILWSLDHPREARQMAVAAQRLVQKRFTPERTRDQLFSLYSRVLGQQPVGRVPRMRKQQPVAE